MDDLAISVNSIVMSDDHDHLNNSNSSNYSTNNIASNIHPRLDAFKKKSNYISNQEERRQQALIEQKKKRHNLIESNRNVNFNFDTKKRSHSNAESNKQLRKILFSPQYNNQLMFSEWLDEVPHDFEKNWIMVVCPVGKRCLVVASEGVTSVYNKAGKLITKHSSKLPGGNKESKIDETILDCIYNYALRTYFILDCISWKSHPIIDSESEFRFYWLKCKLNETSEVTESSYENPYPFKDVPRFDNWTYSTVSDKFQKPYEFEIDGVLFYHKETHYTAGYTPLVGWLKAYMFPEILNIPMPDWIMKRAPSDYRGFRNEINQSQIEMKKLQDYLISIDKMTHEDDDDDDDAVESIQAHDNYDMDAEKENIINSNDNDNYQSDGKSILSSNDQNSCVFNLSTQTETLFSFTKIENTSNNGLNYSSEQ